MSTPYACPNCGAAVGNVRICPNCGMDFWLAAQRTVPPPASAAPAARLTLLDLISLPLAMLGAVVGLVASLLPWLSALGAKTSYWETSKVQDVFLVLFALAVIGLAAAVLIWPGPGVLRLAAMAAVAGLIDFLLPQSIEFMTNDFPGVDGNQAGEIVALLATAMLAAALVLQLIRIGARGPARRPSLVLAGLAVLAAVGLLQPLVELLPVAGGASAWELYTAADVLRALAGLATAGAALAAILLPRIPALTGAALLLGSYTATDNLVSSAEALAADARGAEPFVSLLFLTPLGIAAIVLVAVGSRTAFAGRAPSAVSG